MTKTKVFLALAAWSLVIGAWIFGIIWAEGMPSAAFMYWLGLTIPASWALTVTCFAGGLVSYAIFQSLNLTPWRLGYNSAASRG